MRWERLAVPFNVTVDEKTVTMPKIRDQLRGMAQYTWMGWDEGARYLFESKLDPQEALQWTDKSIQNERRFENVLLKSQILATLGQAEQAAKLRNQALELGSAIQVHMYARQLQNQKQAKEALEIFRLNAKNHPKDWVIHNGLARVYSSEGKYPEAIAELKIAMDGAPEQQKTFMRGFLKKLEAGQDFN
jgi:tetratricopeptide (TPR) repeat protein